MRRSRITITLDQAIVNKIDGLIDHRHIRNRSHAIEYALERYLSSDIREAVVFAGGKGTTLRPLTYEVPKSLLPIQGKPLLFYIIQALKKAGIKRIILCIGYLGEKIAEYFGDGSRFGVEIVYSKEDKPLQTGGALLQAKQYITGQTFLVMNGDIITNFAISDLIRFHQEQNPVLSMALTMVKEPAAFGQLTIHGSKLKKFMQHQGAKTPLVNAGIYVCSDKIFDYFPKGKKLFQFEDCIDTVIEQGKADGFLFQAQWFDVGSAKLYERAIRAYNYSD